MKKYILLVALVVCALSLSGCKKDKQVSTQQQETKQRTNVKETDAKTGEEYYLLADFENYFECSQVSYIASFGTVTEISKEEEPDIFGNPENTDQYYELTTETLNEDEN